VHGACIRSGARECDGFDCRVCGGEEGSGDWSQVAVGVKYYGDKDRFGLEEVTDDGFSINGACCVGRWICYHVLFPHVLSLFDVLQMLVGSGLQTMLYICS
jgi:hypothetical protein